MILKKVFRRIIDIINYLYILANRNRQKASKRVIFVDLNDRRFDIYYTCLIRFLTLGGYYVVVNLRQVLFVGSRAGYFKYIQKMTNLTYGTMRDLSRKNIHFDYLTDKDQFLTCVGVKTIFKINTDYHSLIPGNAAAIAVPFPMHPNNYFIYKMVNRLKDLRMARRTIKIFFSGNIAADTYDNQVVLGNFQVSTRYAIIGYLRSLTNKKIIFLDQDKLPSGDWLSFTYDGLVVNVWETLIGKSDRIFNQIAAENWMHVLSRTDFFLCCPGAVMPQCCNAIEAMAVGSIPLIQRQYAESFHPPLTDNVNAIIFDMLTDLGQKIDEIRLFRPLAIDQMRRNVISYYDSNLTEKSLVLKMVDWPSRVCELYLNVEGVSSKKFLDTRTPHKPAKNCVDDVASQFGQS